MRVSQVIDSWARRPWQWDSWIRAYAWGAGLAVGVGFVWMKLDSRTLLGESVALKPLKFFVSTWLVAVTLPWGQSYLGLETPRIRKWGRVLVGAMVFEVLAITFQAARGVRSHFNNSTPWDAALFSLMGVFILMVWVICFRLTIEIYRRWKKQRDFEGLALIVGMVLFLLGAISAFLMTGPKPDQLAALQAGQVPQEVGGHFKGLADGEGAKLPLLGWSLEAGDFRVGHFIGLHGLQILLILHWVNERRLKQGQASLSNRWIWSLGALILGVTLLALAAAWAGRGLGVLWQQ